MIIKAARSYFVTSLLLIAFFSLSYLIAFLFQIGSTFGNTWIPNVYWLKSYQAATIDKPKIIIISGSNSLFGINSKDMELLTGYPTINLAMHGDLDINFIFSQIQKQIKEGDVVILPLEYSYYNREKMTDFFIDRVMMLGWDYFKSLSPIEFFRFIVSVEPKRVYDGIIRKDRIPAQDISHEQVLTAVRNHIDGKWSGYGYVSLNIHGDINVREKTTEAMKRKNPEYREIHEPISLRFLKEYGKISRMVEKNKGHLILTWPVTLKNKNFDMQQPETKAITTAFRDSLATQGIRIECNPADFNLSRKYFFNTIYHPNYSGAKIRTQRLASCVNGLLNQVDNTELQ